MLNRIRHVWHVKPAVADDHTGGAGADVAPEHAKDVVPGDHPILFVEHALGLLMRAESA